MPVDVLLAAAEQAADPRVPLASIANPQVAAAALGFREGRLLTTASELIARVESSAAGPFYDADVVQSYDRAMLYSALAEWSGTLLDGLSSPDAARELSRLLGRDRAPEARDFQQWLLLRIAARQADPSAAGPATKSAPQEGLSGALQKLLFDREQPPRSLRQQLLQALSELPSLGPEAPLLLNGNIRSGIATELGHVAVKHIFATELIG